MNNATRAKLDRLDELRAQHREIESEIEELLGTSATPPVAKKRGPNVAKASSKPGAVVKKVKGQRLCSLCSKPGHQARTCDKNQPKKYGFDGEKQGQRTCSMCRKAGHRSDTCPTFPPSIPHIKPAQYQCSSCGKRGHNMTECPEPGPLKRHAGPTLGENTKDDALAESIRKRWVEGGSTSVRICEELDISLNQFSRITAKYGIKSPNQDISVSHDLSDDTL